jgi:hypothetical protein
MVRGAPKVYEFLLGMVNSFIRYQKLHPGNNKRRGFVIHHAFYVSLNDLYDTHAPG